MTQRVTWTAKLPAIILGVMSLLGAGIATRHGRIIAGLMLLILAAAFVTYSFAVKEWCELNAHAWGNQWNDLNFDGTLGDCIRKKGWFSF